MMKRAILLVAIVLWGGWVFAETTTKVPSAKREVAKTKDGVKLVFRRYERKGAQPVILVHGLAQNCFHWDLPIKGKSFAKYLYHNGYDVWMANLRSHGKGKFKSETPEKNWSVDDFAIYDVDAIINKVSTTTKQKPYYVGFSMGGMIAYMYLQGIYHHPKTHRVKSDLELAVDRNQKIKGLVTIASPVKMTWRYRANLYRMNNSSFYDYNFVLESLPGRELTMYSFLYMREVPLYKFMNTVFGVEKWGKPGQNKSWSRTLGKRFPFTYVWYAPNMSPEIMESVLKHSVDNISGKVLAQFTHWCLKRTFCEYNVGNKIKNPYIYVDNMYKVITPSYIIGGQNDKIVCDDVIKKYGYKGISSPDRTYKTFKGFGHVDLCVGLNAPTKVYPSILNWLKKQSKKQKSQQNSANLSLQK